MDSYLSKLRGLASSAANAVQSKIGRDYDVNLSGTPLGEAGLWSLFKATRRSSGQLVTVWVFEKRYFEQGINRQLFTTREQNLVLELLKGEASQLTRLRHPSVLQVVEPLEETRGSLMFVTEQVIASLDDLVNPDNRYRPRSGSDWASSGRMVDGEEFELDDLEIQKGLLQVSKGLQFLHNDAKIVHGNLVPASILINAKGDWKLGGFGFAKHLNYSSTHHADGTSDAAKINFEHDYQLPSHTQQNLDFLAPEFVLEGTCSSASDLFSLGCLAFAVHSDGQSPMDCRNDIGAYRREIARLAPDKLSKLPEYLAPVVGSLLVANPAQRLTLSQFQTSKYFDNVLVATIRYLDAIVEQPQDQKIAFMRGLPRVLPKFPDRVMRRKVLPALIDQTNDHALLPFTLPNVFFVVEKLTPKEFVDLALPGLKPVFSILDPPQASIVLLDNLGLLQKKAPTSAFRVDVMPLLYTALTSTVAQVQDKALQAVPTIAETIDYADLKDQLFPRVQQLYSKASVLSLKIRALICLHGMLKSLDKGTIVEKLMPLLKRTKTREPGVMMTMLVMYEEIGLKYVDKEVVAKEILPVLWAQSIDSQLKLDQFKRFMQTVSKLADKVEKEQTKHLDEVRKIEDQTARVTIGGSERAADADAQGAEGWDFMADELEVNQDAGADGFASLVLGGSSSTGSQGTLANPLAPTQQQAKNPTMQNPLAHVAPPASPKSGWEWDAPSFDSKLPPGPARNGGPAFGKSIPVDTDFLSSGPGSSAGAAPSNNGDDDDDDFGSFGSYVPPPKPLPGNAASSSLAAKQVSARLRTAPNFQQPHSKLGATRISSNTAAFGAALPPPPQQQQQPAAKPNYNVNSFAGIQAMKPMAAQQSTNRGAGLSFGQNRPSSQVLMPVPRSPPNKQGGAQAHAGGKSSHLGDFDPFA